jgi:hypothetical protein
MVARQWRHNEISKLLQLDGSDLSNAAQTTHSPICWSLDDKSELLRLTNENHRVDIRVSYQWSKMEVLANMMQQMIYA